MAARSIKQRIRPTAFRAFGRKLPMDTQQAQATAQPATSWWQRLFARDTLRKEGITAERGLLDMENCTNFEQHTTQIGPNSEDFIHSLEGPKTVQGPPLVIVPGYGAGVGFFFKNLTWLSSRFRVSAVDLLGTGLSGRPHFSARNRQEAEAFFTDSLDKWREANGLGAPDRKFILCGHSLGGYMAASYAMKYPQHVEHLVLVGCAGVGKKPEDWVPPAALMDSWQLKARYKAVELGWNWGLTPGTIVRGIPQQLGRNLARWYSSGRFNFNESEVSVFERYLYSILAQKGSGEHALRHILEPFAWAAAPLESRLDELKNVPVTFVYGAHDWMNPQSGLKCCQILRELRSPLNASDTKHLVIDRAGHNPFLDRPDAFNEAMAEACKPFLKHGWTGGHQSDLHDVEKMSQLPSKPDAPDNVEETMADL